LGGADPKVVQRILGYASAAMTVDVYGHLLDQNLWEAAKKVNRRDPGHDGGIFGAPDGNQRSVGRGQDV
jgi:hypothetical protein